MYMKYCGKCLLKKPLKNLQSFWVEENLKKIIN
jgi:hypothetical protein